MFMDETLCCQRGCHVNSLLVEGAAYNVLTSIKRLVAIHLMASCGVHKTPGYQVPQVIRIGTDLLKSTYDRCLTDR